MEVLGIKELSNNFNDFYSEKEILGEGTVGTVKRCVWLKDNKVFAVKIIRTRNEEIIENMKKEF